MEKYSCMIVHKIIYIIGYKNVLVSYFYKKQKNQWEHWGCITAVCILEGESQNLRLINQLCVATERTSMDDDL